MIGSLPVGIFHRVRRDFESLMDLIAKEKNLPEPHSFADRTPYPVLTWPQRLDGVAARAYAALPESRRGTEATLFSTDSARWFGFAFHISHGRTGATKIPGDGDGIGKCNLSILAIDLLLHDAEPAAGAPANPFLEAKLLPGYPDLTSVQDAVYRALTDEYQSAMDIATAAGVDAIAARRELPNLKRMNLVDHKPRVGYRRKCAHSVRTNLK